MPRNWQERIFVSMDIHHGDACIKGTRVPVSVIIGSLADGKSAEEILNVYPQISNADIQACLAYAAEVIH